MRQIAKSAMSLGWALSLLGAKQAYGAVAARGAKQGDLLGPVTQVAVGQLDDSMKRIHRSADALESRMLDMAFSLLNPTQWLKGQAWPFSNTACANRGESPKSSAGSQSRTNDGQDDGYNNSSGFSSISDESTTGDEDDAGAD